MVISTKISKVLTRAAAAAVTDGPVARRVPGQVKLGHLHVLRDLDGLVTAVFPHVFQLVPGVGVYRETKK